MKTLSYTLFQNTELIGLLIACICALLVIVLLFRYVPFHFHTEEKQTKPVLPFLNASRRTGHYTKKDWFWVVCITVLYAIVSLWQLGSSSMPSTTWQPSSTSEFLILELDEDTHFDAVYAIYGEGDNSSNLDTYQLGFHNIQITGSNDHETWEHICYLNDGSIYQYLISEGDWDYKYIGIVSTNKNDTLTEIAFKASGEDRLLSVKVDTDSVPDSAYSADLVIDEQDEVALHPTYYDQGYFDEIYHPRNAWEISTGEYMYASVHPLLGTSLIALSISIFGMNPLAWRLPGAIFGIMMIPLMYAILKLLFRKTDYAALGSVLLAADFMHLTTSRIATLEPFSVFFIMLMFYYMLKYFFSSFYDTPFRKTLLYLLASGISMALGIATKWTACYSAVGLAIILFAAWGIRYYEYRQASKMLRQDTIASLSAEQLQMCRKIHHTFFPSLYKSIAWCFLFFIGIPVIIYFASYIWTPVWRDGYSIQNVLDQIEYMYNYHTNLDATHPYQSSWYQWILDIRPIWYYYGTDANGYSNSISCFSNPLICWAGLLSVIYTAVDIFRHKSKEAFVITIGYFTALIPWMLLVKRCVFAYHYYPASIFMIMAIVYACRSLIRKDRKWKNIIIAFAVLSAVLFIIFLPVTAGFGTSVSYIKMLEWFPSWYFG